MTSDPDTPLQAPPHGRALQGSDVLWVTIYIAAGLVALFVVFVAVGAFVGILDDGSGDMAAALEQSSFNTMLGGILIYGSVLGGVYWATMGRGRIDFGSLGFRRTEPGWIVAAVLLAPAASLIGVLVVFLGLDAADESATRELIMPAGSSIPLLLMTFLVIAFLAPICEEIYFRGLLFGWAKERWGFMWPALVTSLLFAGVHLQFALADFIVLGSVGFISAYIYQKSGSLWPSVVLHGSYNSLVVLVILFS